MRDRSLDRLLIATHNAGKLDEFRHLLEPFRIEAVSAGDLGLPEPDETGTTFLANARLKAEAAASVAMMPALADDSGLCVDALDGAPGIYSARWAGPDKDFPAAMARIDTLLRQRGALGPAARRAQFTAALALVWPDGRCETVEGEVRGTIVYPPRGGRGFGYDPLFLPDGHDRTFGEMTAQEKHGIPADGSDALSHRARAFQRLARRCFTPS
jgi:XTP/dITP diphosphohydrolase